MATTGTYAFNPAASNLLLTAFGRLQIRSPEITDQHLADAEVEGNLLQVEIGNKQPNAWSQELYQISLVEGTATYNLPARLIAIRDVFLSTQYASGSSQDTVIWPLSTQDYDAQAQKTQSGVPTSYWMNRLINPTITMWPVPDGNATYTLNVRMLSQVQDATLRNGANLDMPYRFLDVWVAGMAHRMARIYKPEVEGLRKADYLEAWANAASQDLDDNVGMTIGPDLSGYYNR